jgi:hypothetical protein
MVHPSIPLTITTAGFFSKFAAAAASDTLSESF